MRYRLLLLAWLVSDALLLVAAYALAYFVRVGWVFSSDFPFAPYIVTVLLVAPVWLVVMLTTRAYAITRSQRTPRNVAYVTYACVMAVSLFAITYYFLFGAFFSRLLLLQALVLSTATIILWHVIFEQILRRVLRRDPPVFPTLVVGVTRESTRLIKELNAKRNPLKPVAILDGAGTKEKEIDGVPVLGKLNKLEEVLDRYRITHLIQCSDMEQSLNLLSACRNKSITYLVLPSVFGIVERDERVESLEGFGVTMVSPRQRWRAWVFG